MLAEHQILMRLVGPSEDQPSKHWEQEVVRASSMPKHNACSGRFYRRSSPTAIEEIYCQHYIQYNADQPINLTRYALR